MALILGGVVGGVLLLAGIVVAIVLSSRDGDDPQVSQNLNRPDKPRWQPDKAPVGRDRPARPNEAAELSRDRNRPQRPDFDPAGERLEIPADGTRPPKNGPKAEEEEDEPRHPAKDNSRPSKPRVEQPGPDEPVVEQPESKAAPLLVLDAGGHSAVVRRALFTPNGLQIVTVSADKTIRVWDVSTGDTLRVFRLPIGPGDEGALEAAAISPDGKLLVVSGMPVGRGVHGMPIHLISLESGRVVKVFRGHRNVVRSLAFSAGGKYLASASADQTVLVYQVNTGEPVRQLRGHRAPLREVAFSPDGLHLATVADDQTTRIWSFTTAKEIAVLTTDTTRFLSIAWSPDSKTLATGKQEGTIQLWNARGQFQKEYRIDAGKERVQLTSLHFNKAGTELLYTGIDALGHAGIFSLKTGKVRVAFSRHTNTVMDGCLSPDGTLAATAGGDNHETYVWKTATGDVVQKLQGAGQSVYGVGWSLDGKSIGWGNTNQGRTTQAEPPLENSFRPAELDFGEPPTADGYGRMVSRHNGYALEALDFYRVAISFQGRRLHVFTTPQKGDRIYSFTMLADGHAVIGASFGLYRVNVRTNQIVREHRGHSGLILGVCPSPDGKYFLTGSTDQTLRIWSGDREEPLLSLFVAGRDWIAWTPEGYYAASAYGERLMGWQINHGPDELASYYPAVQFRLSLYRPDVIKLLLSAGSVAKALAQASQGNRPVDPVNVAQVLPPKVRITSPVAAVETNKSKLEVKALAQSAGKNPVVAMRLLVDGRPYRGVRGIRVVERPRLGRVQASWSVALTPGKHTLAVQAASAVSKGISAPVQITCAAGNQDELPNLYVLAVGVSAYPGEMRLHFAATDAESIARVLREKTRRVFDKVEVRLLTDAQATRKEIYKGLAWLDSMMTPKDVGVMFFSGHGARDPRGTFYLIPVDVDPNDPANTCVPGELVKDALGNMPGRLIAILDACHSGAVADGKRPARRAAADDLARDLVTDDYGVVTLCSSQGREYSMESPLVGGGFYTQSLVEGLSGKADFNGDHVVYLHELERYATLRVRQLTRGLQNPATGRPTTIRSFPLSRN
jgi:WD40 repeat protein